MKIRHLHIIGISLSMAAVTLLTGCSKEENPQDVRPIRDMYMVMGSHAYSDLTEITPTRALPSGYEVYENLSLQMDMEDIKIRAFVTQENEVKFQGDFVYDTRGTTHVWGSKVPIDEGDYYIYGFLPSSQVKGVNITPLSGGNFANGAQMTLEHLSPIISYDPCVIVGVKGSSSGTTPIADMNMQLGQFIYNAENNEYIYVLIDHLYAALDIRMEIDAGYNKLRTIEVTKLELKPHETSEVTKPVTLTAKLTPGTTTPLAITTELETSGTLVGWQTVYQAKGQGKGMLLKDNTQGTDYRQQFMACIATGVKASAVSKENKIFQIRSTYNVYDKEGNLVRKDCQAINKLTLPETFFNSQSDLAAGEKYIFFLKVNPTYLYVLSEPDLDNPMVTVN